MKVASSILLVFALYAYVWPQDASNSTVNTNSNEWIRVASDDGEFSAEVPSKNYFFFDPDGFSVEKNRDDFELKKMYMLTGLIHGTLVSFESYDESRKAAFDALYDADENDDKGRKSSEKQVGNIKIKEVRNSTKELFVIRQFIRTDKRIYVLTAASRNANSPELSRFLDSVRFNDLSNAPRVEEMKFSQLKPQIPKIIFQDAIRPPTDSANTTPAPPPEPGALPALPVRVTRVSYVPLARDRQTTGTVVLRLKISEDAAISEIIVQHSLPDGLLKQAIFGAIRSKILPREKNGLPVSVYKTLEFGFHMY